GRFSDRCSPSSRLFNTSRDSASKRAVEENKTFRTTFPSAIKRCSLPTRSLSRIFRYGSRRGSSASVILVKEPYESVRICLIARSEERRVGKECRPPKTPKHQR